MASVPKVQRVTAAAWVDLRAKIKTMTGFAQVRPAKAEEAFRYSVQGDGVRVDVGPVCFQLKEKPQSDKADLYVTVEGYIELQDIAGQLRSIGYYSRVGYFRQRNGQLEHVFGIHHDYDPDLIAHPVYHAQMAPMLELAEHINTLFNVDFGPPTDFVTPILAKVRVPTTRMDPFAVFLQLCADHLVAGTSGNAPLKAFKAAIETCGFFEGACSTIPRLVPALAAKSLRSHHWYRR